MVSAIWAVDFAGLEVVGIAEPSALIHNPNALNCLPRGFLIVDDEYEAVPEGEDKLFFQLVGRCR
ncbi:MAG: hypothetical protein E6K53_16125 [Gammaproteobacteria bacterium]|nr:MAG: hypothetical protein E6K53_16125 [Gammaproteobacteria bacterium]